MLWAGCTPSESHVEIMWLPVHLGIFWKKLKFLPASENIFTPQNPSDNGNHFSTSYCLEFFLAPCRIPGIPSSFPVVTPSLIVIISDAISWSNKRPPSAMVNPVLPPKIISRRRNNIFSAIFQCRSIGNILKMYWNTYISRWIIRRVQPAHIRLVQ